MSQKTTKEIVTEAVGTGQLLTVTYQGGRAPGYKRKIMIRSVDEDGMQVREFPGDIPRTYLLSRTNIVDDDHSAPWMPESSGKAIAVEPKSYFSGWAFAIEPSYFSALGVNARYVIDDAKTRPARERAIEQGMPRKEATKRIKIMRREDAVGVPPAYAFHEGDIFYRGGYGSSDWVQIVKIHTVHTIQEIEAHFPSPSGRVAVVLSPAMLAHLLKSGDAPPAERQISPSQSGSDALRMMIQRPGLG